MFYDQFCVHYRRAFDPAAFVKGCDPYHVIEIVGCTGAGLTVVAGIARWRDENENLYEIPVADLIGVYPL